ncbi:unnamed protein product [Didymodactylos carnosus]|uniref:RING-type domain-containing protein n=2 Tax=Didymodactylos carnosus TaxID=1234261 RepID=A0A814EFT6_9BILA|nr:unnamed protein product [Didymodactylos carnosus]CAF3739380.1 unnamed protein product [Didymodactylos carnosus]
MDTLAQCEACHQIANDPLELKCKHTYCSKCLKEKLVGNKVTCVVCNVEHVTPSSNITDISTSDKLVPYLIGVHSKEPYANIPESTPTIQAICFECKAQADLRTCFHCEKPLCEACRTKHYESQKKEVDKLQAELGTGIAGSLSLATELNNSRENRITTYTHTKEKIQEHAKALRKYIDEEEAALLKQVDTRVILEQEKIKVTRQEEEHLKKHKVALEKVVDTYKNEPDKMIATKMFADYVHVAPVWKSKVETQAGRLNPKKEQELHYHSQMPKKEDALVGSIKDTKADIDASSEAKKLSRDANAKSSACIIA